MSPVELDSSGALATAAPPADGMAAAAAAANSFPGTTTTISTIAVRAEPHSTVVVALLKSIGYVDLRIDKMHPGLLEIGSDPEENAQLLLIHADLFQRLLSKQEQVEELLGRAEQLVHEQTEPGDVLVYEAMADGLAAAWKGLSRQLEMRGFILEDTQRLYDLAQKHEELSKLLNSRLQKEAPGKGEIEQVERMVNDLANLTGRGMDIGSDVIGQIRVLASLADNADRPREAFEACLDIEKVMLKMAQSWELLEGAWRELKPLMDAPRAESSAAAEAWQRMAEAPQEEAPNFDVQLESAEDWLNKAQRRFEHLRGDQQANAEKLEELTQETRTQQSSLQTLAEHIYARSTALPPAMSSKCAELLERHNLLLKEMEGDRELLAASLKWLADADALLAQLTKMRMELGQADEKMAAELGPLAQQKGVALIDQGGQLVAQLRAEDRAQAQLAEKIAQKMEQLKALVIELVQLARERIAVGKRQKLTEKRASLEQWLHSVADPFLTQPVKLAQEAAETGDFIARHRRFGADLTDKEQQMQSLLGQQKLLGAEEAEKLTKLQQRMAETRELLERRLQLANKLEQLQKLSRDLETSFHFLSSLLQQQGHGGPQQPNAGQQMRHLLQSLNEFCIQEKHKAESFQVLSSTAREADPALGLDQALVWSRAQMAAHQTQLRALTEKCQDWEQKRDIATADGKGMQAPAFAMALPDKKLIWEGQRLELLAKVEAVPEPRVYWLKDGLELRERTGQCRMGWLNGMASLVIEEVLAEDAGQYTLRAENQLGMAEGNMELVVEASPNRERSTMALTQQQQQNTTTTTVVSVQEEQQQQQQQIVEELGEFKPRFVRQLQNVSVREGDQFMLDCVVVGNPEPKIIWYREEQTLRESDRVRLSFKGDHCTLSCANASGEDAGLYKVLAVNLHGETMNFCRVCIVPPSPKRKMPPPTPPKPATPILLQKNQGEEQQQFMVGQQPATGQQPVAASIESQLCSQVVREGQTVVFQTQVRGTPTPEVRWLFNGEPMPVDRPDLGLSRDPEGRCSLTIPCVLLHHAGQYGIEAENQIGQANSTATLNVLLGVGWRGVEEAQFGDGNGFDRPAEEAEDNGWPQRNQKSKKTEQRTMNSSSSQHYYQQQQQNIDYFSDSFQQQQMANGGQTVLGGSSSYSRWSTESPHQQQGPVYAVSKSARAESRRASSNDLGDPGYSSLANAPECLRPFPAELTVEEGEKAEVDCLMLGNPRPKVQWFFNGRPIKPGYQGDFVELTVSNIGDTYSIRFNPAQLHFSGWYRCVTENIRGRCESLTLIHVRPRSMIQRPGGYQHQKARRSIGGVQGLLQLQKQQQQMLQQQQTRALSTPPRPMNAATPSSTPFSSFTPTLQRDRGQQMPALMSMSAYQAREEPTALPAGGLLHFAPNAQQPLLVEAHSEHRILTDQLLAQYSAFDQQQTKGSPPHFMQTLVSAVVAEGQPVRFEAVVTGLPQPRLEWTKDGQPLSPSPNLRIWTEGGRALLAINEVGEQEAGKYCCKVENASGMASSSAQLVLRPKTMAPDFLGRLISEEVEEGAVLKWTVRASGEPEPTVSWLRDGQPIAEVQGVALAKEGPFLYTLLIDQVQVSDAGQFTCVLENSAGEARSTADLVVRPRGSAPGKYVHVTKVTQEKQTRGEELARNETVTIEGQMASALEVGQGEEEKEEEEEEEEGEGK